MILKVLSEIISATLDSSKRCVMFKIKWNYLQINAEK